MYFHLTARLSPRSRPLVGRAARWLWHALRRRFPLAVAVVLMPNHLHLIVALADAEEGRMALARILQEHTRLFRLGAWATAPSEPPIRDRHHLRRQVRYVALNPCRARYVDDPLRWLWSTHRDVVGASADPWVTASRLARALEQEEAGFAREHHAYVAGDPSVRSSPFPEERDESDATLRALALAASAATRHVGDHRSTRRRAIALFLATARSVRYPVIRCLDTAGMPSSTAFRWSRRPTPAAVAAARLCLSDPRLRDPVDSVLSTDLRLRRRRGGGRRARQTLPDRQGIDDARPGHRPAGALASHPGVDFRLLPSIPTATPPAPPAPP